jgi:ribokinase
MVRQYDVITIGESTIDAFMTIHDASEKAHLDKDAGELCFKFGEKINVERYDFSIGGNATNVAVGLSRLGLKAALCAEIGDDEFSIKIRNNLAKESIERVLVHQVQGPSGFSVIINFKGDRTLFIQNIKREHNFHLKEVSAKWVFLTSLGHEWEKPYKHALDFVLSEKCKLAFNPGHSQLQEGRDVVRKVLEHTDILFVNKEEAELILLHHYSEKVDNTDDYLKALAERLQKIGPRAVVITNGKHGSCGLDEEGNFYTQDLYPGEAVERTGAGDAYASGFLGARLYERHFKEAMLWGSINAAGVVGQIGAEAGLVKKEEMEKKASE